MTWTSVPWAVDGADHPVELLRLLAYVSVLGREGVVRPGDLKVVPQTPAGPGVVVSNGAAGILNRAQGGDRQSYVGENPTPDYPGIANTGSGSGRTDLVVVRVEDPNEPGQAGYQSNVTSAANGPYIFTRVIPNVPAGTKRLQDVPGHETDSGFAIARVTQPANNATITAAMITDLRQLINPREKTRSYKGALPSPADRFALSGAYTTFPSNDISGIDIPEWATHAIVRMETTVRGVSGNVKAAFQSFLTTGVRDPSTLFCDMTIDIPTSAGELRQPLLALSSGAFAIPAGMRGQTAKITSRVTSAEAGATGTMAGSSTDYYSATIVWLELLA